MVADRRTGYGRYDDDPDYVGCPRAHTDMTPCVARDGSTALALPDEPLCIGCGADPGRLLAELRNVLELPSAEDGMSAGTAAGQLVALVRSSTEPDLVHRARLHP